MPKLKVNSVDIYYQKKGNGQPLIFIHGLGSSTQDWEHQIPVFSTLYKTVTYDLRGHGQSGKPRGPYRIPMFADDLYRLLQALDLEAVHLVGISLGGCIALQFTIDHPDMVRTLTIVNSGPKFGDSTEQAQQEVDRRVDIVQHMGMRAMGESISENLLPDPEHLALRSKFVERWSGNDPRAYIAATRSLLGWDVVNKLGFIKSPALVISADQDYSPVEAKLAYIKLMPNARLAVIPDAHHFVPVERPSNFNEILKGFLFEHS